MHHDRDGKKVIAGEFEKLLKSEVVPALMQKRKESSRLSVSKPGAAEFLDLVKVLLSLEEGERAEAFAEVKDFALTKSRKEVL